MKERFEGSGSIDRVEQHKVILAGITCPCGRDSLRTVTFYNLEQYTNGISPESAVRHVQAQIHGSVGCCACGRSQRISEDEALRIASAIRKGKPFDTKGE